MIDHRQLVEEMRSAISSNHAFDGEMLSDVAAMYAEACDNVNRRLREVHQILAKGHRSEAIQCCEDEKLLEDAAILDFPDQEGWIALLTERGMVLPPPLRLDLAAELNEAYADHASLGSLLKKHRLLALARAPLAPRIQLLRRIAQADPKNAAWPDDLMLFERARLKEIDRQLETARRNEDVGELQALEAELRSPAWSARPSGELVEKAAALRADAAAKYARTALRQLAQQLNEAYAAFDVELGRKLRCRWTDLLPVARLDAADDLADQTAPALEWLVEQDRRDAIEKEWRAACAALERALEDGATAADLQRLYHAVMRCEHGIPELLQSRYDQRLRSLEITASRKFRLIVAVVSAVLVMIAALIVWSIASRSHQRRIAIEVQTIRKFSSDPDKHELGKTRIRNLERDAPDVFRSPEVQREIAEFQRAAAKEKERRTVFADAMEKAREALKTAREAGLENPDSAAIRTAEEAERTAQEHQRTAQEENEVGELHAGITEWKQRIQAGINARFVAELDKFRERLKVVEHSERMGILELKQALQPIKSDLESLVSRSRQVTSDVRGQAKPLGDRIDARLAGLAELERQQPIRDRLTAAVGDVERYASSLEFFAEAFPTADATPEFRKALQESSLWQALWEWIAFLNRPEFQSLRSISPEEANQLIGQADQLLVRYRAIPLADEYERRADFLQKAAARAGSDAMPIHAELVRVFGDPLVSRVWMIVDQGGARYYATKEPTATARPPFQVAFDYVQECDLTTARRQLLVTELRTREKPYYALAPQCEIAEKAHHVFAGMPSNTWEKTMYDLYELVLVEKQPEPDRQVDPILRVLLAHKVLKTACQGSYCLEEAFREQLAALSAAPFDEKTPWMKPDDPVIAQARDDAREMLADLKGQVDEAALRAGELLREMSRPPDSSYRWVGWLSRDFWGRWVCSSPKPDFTGNLVVIVPDVSRACELKPIGRAELGVVRWQDPIDDRFLQGRPIFLRERKAK